MHPYCRQRRIALSFPLRPEPWQDIVRGVYRYAETNPSLAITIHAEEDVGNAVASEPDGVIAMVRTRETARKLLEWGGPVVDTAGELDHRPFVLVGYDALAAGRMAADHLMLLKGRSFACLGNVQGSAGRLMHQGFAEQLQSSALPVEETPEAVAQEALNETSDLHATVLWLGSFHQPVALYAFHDSLARRVASASVAAGLRVPQDVAILGCLNDDFLCTVSQPTLSSISLPTPAIGFEAARVLEAMMGSAAVPERIELPPLAVATRQSTDAAALAEPTLAAALRFIRENSRERIGVEDIAAACGLSRSSLERRFRAVVGRGPLAELLRERVERARQLLIETDLEMKEIAAAVGFSDVRHLSVTFRQKIGVSPGKFRARFRPR
jgi:LacI family transcriptional regulator